MRRFRSKEYLTCVTQLGSDLVAALASLDVQDLTHFHCQVKLNGAFWGEEETFGGRRECSGVK